MIGFQNQPLHLKGKISDCHCRLTLEIKCYKEAGKAHRTLGVPMCHKSIWVYPNPRILVLDCNTLNPLKLVIELVCKVMPITHI